MGTSMKSWYNFWVILGKPLGLTLFCGQLSIFFGLTIVIWDFVRILGILRFVRNYLVIVEELTEIPWWTFGIVFEDFWSKSWRFYEEIQNILGELLELLRKTFRSTFCAYGDSGKTFGIFWQELWLYFTKTFEGTYRRFWLVVQYYMIDFQENVQRFYGWGEAWIFFGEHFCEHEIEKKKFWQLLENLPLDRFWTFEDRLVNIWYILSTFRGFLILRVPLWTFWAIPFEDAYTLQQENPNNYTEHSKLRHILLFFF